MTGFAQAAPRPLTSDDAEPARALARRTLDSTPYVERVLELVSSAAGGDPEYRALVTVGELKAVASALAIFGPVGGAAGAWQLYTLLVAPDVPVRDTGRAMVEALLRDARRDGARFLMAELPADPALGATLTLLRANGFRQEGRIADFHRDGVARLFLRREL